MNVMMMILPGKYETFSFVPYILKRMFHKCTLAVKLTLFKCYCMYQLSLDLFTISVYGVNILLWL